MGSFFSGSLGDRYHAPTIVGIGLMGSGLAILCLAVGFWTNFIAIDAAASHFVFLVRTTFPIIFLFLDVTDNFIETIIRQIVR